MCFKETLEGSKRKPNKIWVDKGSEFYSSSFKKWLNDNDIEIYSRNNEEKSIIAESVLFIRTLKNKIHKHNTSISKNVYIYKLDDIVNEYTAIHIIEQLKWNLLVLSLVIMLNAILISMIKIQKLVIIYEKYKNVFAKGYTPNWPKEVFVIKEGKNTAPLAHVINDLNGEEIIGTFYEKELQKINQKEFRT